MYKALILDMDGTVINTRQIVLDALEVLAAEFDVTLTDQDRMNSLGSGAESFMASLGREDQADEMSFRWREIMGGMLGNVALFQGFDEVLEAPVRRGLVTNETTEELRENFQRLDLYGVFEHTVCAGDLPHPKPHPMPLLHCLEAMGITPRDALFVGDTSYDLECALAAGVDFGLALWGAGTPDGFEQASFFFKEPREILSYIESVRQPVLRG